MVLRELFPNAIIRPFLIMPDKSKTTQIDQIHSLFRLRRIEHPGRKFTSVVVDFIGDPAQLRRDHFLTQVSVEAEVRLLLPDVKSAAEKYLASLQPKLQKISTPISVACRGCEYDFSVENDAKNGFRECWGKLADIEPHMLDLYHVSSVGGRGGPVANNLIGKGKVGLFDVPEASLVKADGSVGEVNKRQLIQIEYTRKNAEWMNQGFPRILKGFKYPLHFIDFETTAVAVPYHAGMHPYEQVAFQWANASLYKATDSPLRAMAQFSARILQGSAASLWPFSHRRGALRWNYAPALPARSVRDSHMFWLVPPTHSGSCEARRLRFRVPGNVV